MNFVVYIIYIYITNSKLNSAQTLAALQPSNTFPPVKFTILRLALSFSKVFV